MAVYQLAFGGALFTDVWECTLHLEGTIANIMGSGPGSNAMDDVADDVRKWFLASEFINAAKLSWVKLNEIDPVTKRYTSKTTTNEKRWDTPIPGGAGDYLVPPHLSVCISLLTEQKRGAAARGRFYPPPTRWITSLDTNGKIQSAQTEKYAAAAQTFLTNLNNWPGIDNALGASGDVVVLGKGGATNNVNRVAIGDVVDTQRRRRSALREVYTVKSL